MFSNDRSYDRSYILSYDPSYDHFYDRSLFLIAPMFSYDHFLYQIASMLRLQLPTVNTQGGGYLNARQVCSGFSWCRLI